MTVVAEAPQTFTEGGNQYALWIPSDVIQNRIQAVGNHIAQVYSGKRLRMTVVLEGGLPFFNVLLAAIESAPNGPAEIQADRLRVKSYDGERSGELEWKVEPLLEDDPEVHQLLVEDIVDSGNTFSKVVAVERARTLASVGTVALLNRPEARQLATPFVPDFVAFEITNPEVWAVGFGMDIKERYRDLPDIYGKVIRGQDMPGYQMPALHVPHQFFLPKAVTKAVA